MTVDFETKCEQTALDYIKIHLQEGYLVTAYKDVGNYYWESVYKIRASLSTNRKTKQTERGSDDFQNDISASHMLWTMEDSDEQPLKGSERLLKGYSVKTPQKSRDSHEIAKDEPQTDWHYDEQDATWYPYKHEDEPQQKSCATCKHALGNWDGESNNCGRCCGADRRFYEPKDEPQTERSE